MKLKYDKQKGHRIRYGFLGFRVMGDQQLIYHWNKTHKRWEHDDYRTPNSVLSTHQPCRSVRAFRRKLKFAPAGVRFRLESLWVGYDVEGVGTSDKYNHQQKEK